MRRMMLGLVLVGALASSNALARESGIQGTPDGKRVLVNKDVGSSRYAIARDQDDGSATGNVFFTDDRAPAFLLCSAQGGSDFSCAVADPCPSTGRESGIQRRPDGKGVLVSKDVAGSRYAITANADDASLTGNVFFTDGRPPVFLFCQSLGNNAYSCSGADRCGDTTCAPYTFLANITLPADFFTVPAGCPSFQTVGTVTLPTDFFGVPSTTRGPLNVSARQVVTANPFGSLTKIQPIGAAGRRSRHARSVQAASTSREESFECLGGGSRNLVCEVLSGDDGTPVTIASLEGDDCTFPLNDGAIQVENGFTYTAVPDFADCAEPFPFLVGIEQVEQRDPLILEFIDAEGFLLERHSEATTRLVTFGAECTNTGGSRFADEIVRDITGAVESVYFDDAGEIHVFDDFQHVDQTITYSAAPECSATYDLTAGSITTIDGLTGEVFTTTYGREGGIQFSLEDSVLLIDGGLTSECSGAQSSFTFRTLQAPLFDEADPSACPRDGRVEVSSNGTVIGQIVFTVEGGLQLIEADGRVTSFATCNDAGLLLRCG